MLRERALLAVSSRHPFARRPSVSLADLTRAVVLRSHEALPDYWDDTVVHAPLGERGPAFATIQEMLALIGAGSGVFPVPEQARRHYARPDVTYVPIDDAPHWQWVLVWVAAARTRRTREFTQAAPRRHPHRPWAVDRGGMTETQNSIDVVRSPRPGESKDAATSSAQR